MEAGPARVKASRGTFCPLLSSAGFRALVVIVLPDAKHTAAQSGRAVVGAAPADAALHSGRSSTRISQSSSSMRCVAGVEGLPLLFLSASVLKQQCGADF